ncbi:MAG: ATP-binding cassette domain-containing protein, partial [Pseudomonadota bacterium]|nr:ATP-binding cassette domain-containing protein [Pseudomonadota bacterium]
MRTRATRCAIEVIDLNKRFGAISAVEHVTFSVKRGETYALLGANGAGKTTTLAMLLGLMIPDSGQIFVLNVDMLRDRYRVLSRINYASPYVDLPQRLKVLQNLTVYC